jgi:hypothetical protein
MFNPTTTIIHSFKEIPVDSEFFKYTRLIPIIGFVIQLSKLFILRKEIYTDSLNSPGISDQVKLKKYKQAQMKVKQMEHLKRVTEHGQGVDILMVITGIAIAKFMLLPTLAYSVIAAGILVGVSRCVIPFIMISSTQAYLKQNNPKQKGRLH